MKRTQEQVRASQASVSQVSICHSFSVNTMVGEILTNIILTLKSKFTKYFLHQKNLMVNIAIEIFILLQAKQRVAELKEQHRSITANLALYPSTQSVDMATLTPDDAASIPTLESDAVSHIATVINLYNAVLYYKPGHIAWNPMSNFYGLINHKFPLQGFMEWCISWQLV